MKGEIFYVSLIPNFLIFLIIFPLLFVFYFCSIVREQLRLEDLLNFLMNLSVGHGFIGSGKA